jgi:hypothetical protein
MWQGKAQKAPKNLDALAKHTKHWAMQGGGLNMIGFMSGRHHDKKNRIFGASGVHQGAGTDFLNTLRFGHLGDRHIKRPI